MLFDGVSATLKSLDLKQSKVLH